MTYQLIEARAFYTLQEGDFLWAPRIDFPFADAGIAKLGEFLPSVGGGHNFVGAVGARSAGHSYIDMIVTGRTCKAQLFGGTYLLTIDGGAPTTITAPSGWSFVTLFDGPTDGTHRITLEGDYYDSDIALEITGAPPRLTRPTDIPAGFYPLGAAPFTTYGAQDGVFGTSGIGYTVDQRLWNAGSGCGLRFKATTAAVALWLFTGIPSGRVALLQDGVQIAEVTPPDVSGGPYNLVTLATGLSGSHEYEVQFIWAGYSNYVYAVLVDSLDTVAHAARPIDAHYGDSIVSETASSIAFDARQGDPYLIANATGHASIHYGLSGQQVSTVLRDSTAAITSIPTAPARVFITAGTNDMANGVAVSTFQADYQTMLSNLRAGLPSAVIYARGILPRLGYTSLRDTFNAAISAAVAALSDANIHYVNTDGWIDPTNGVDTLEGLHPTAAGYAKIAAAQLAVL